MHNLDAATINTREQWATMATVIVGLVLDWGK